MICATLTRQQSNQIYSDVLRDNDVEAQRQLCREDLFYLLTVACKRKDIDHPWIYARCREVESGPDGFIDLWFRDGYKSSLITFGKTIQDILVDPEVTFGLHSHTRPIAKAFLSQIKMELEQNTYLQNLFPEILYQNPQRESPRWSLDGGIVVKRTTNPKEATVEAWGLVDGQPTSKHFGKQVYDDVVTKESVTTPEMIKKTTDAWALSLNLGSSREGREVVRRYVGTRYHMNDSYSEIIRRGAAKERYHYPTDLGKDDIEAFGKPYLLSREQLLDKRRQMAIYVYGSQMLQNPKADAVMGFKLEWIQTYHTLKNHFNWNYYLLCDPASEKKKTSDYTVMNVIGLAPDRNYYLVDALRDRLNLTQRTDALFKLVQKWHPKAIGYEKYGKDSDIEHIKYVQEQQGYRFVITELGGSMPKNDRIRRLVPIFEQRRFFVPVRMLFTTVEGKVLDYTQIFTNEEFLDFPVAKHDDMLDCMARIVDESLGAVFPKPEAPKTMVTPEPYHPLQGYVYKPAATTQPEPSNYHPLNM